LISKLGRRGTNHCFFLKIKNINIIIYMLKLTPYGFFGGLGTFLGLSLLKEKTFSIFFALILTMLLQPLLCTKCLGNFSLSAFIGIFPLMLLLLILDCDLLKSCIIVLSLMFAVGRIGCFFAGCCTGKPCNPSFPFTLHYKKGSVLVDKYYKKNMSVYPTILLEIFLQFILFYLVWTSDYGLIIFGIGNAILLYLTGMWRDQSRPNSWPSIFGLVLFSILSYLKCGKSKAKCCLKFNPDILSLIVAIIVSIFLSNDIFFK